MDNQADTRPNIYLVGFMGTGKSAVGRSLSEALGLRFIDSDQVIESEQGRPITEIFASEGEAHFRALERRFVEAGHPRSGCVVSTGGGMVTQAGIAEKLRELGLVVVLCATAECIYERTRHSSHRPLLNCENPLERIRTLLAARAEAYGSAGIQISTDHRPLKDVVAHVERLYKEKCMQA